jgi:hypothetical protein
MKQMTQEERFDLIEECSLRARRAERFVQRMVDKYGEGSPADEEHLDPEDIPDYRIMIEDAKFLEKAADDLGWDDIGPSPLHSSDAVWG